MAPPVIHPADRLSRLPDEILAQILLPAQEAVRTCVLARTWRDVWKFTRRLIITGDSAEEVQEFVDRLLRLRLNGLKRAPLDECEIKFPKMSGRGDYDTGGTVNGWIHTSLKCQVKVVQVLRVLNDYEVPGLHGRNDYILRSARPLISPHLTRLELRGAWLKRDFFNLDHCPALEHLEIRSCLLHSMGRIVSPSLKRLVITECDSFDGGEFFKISAPCLVSLLLDVELRVPLLESMPQLAEAFVRVDWCWDNDCSCYIPKGYLVSRSSHISDGGNIEDYISSETNTEGCVLLDGLSQAKHLVLLVYHSTYMFRRDLRMCPTFSNLKTLVLNGCWCEPADCRPLACILEHAPVLENLTVVFSDEVELEYDIVLEGCPDAAAESTMTTQCLKTVKVKCHTVDEGVQNVLKFLSTLNICFNSE